MQTRTEKDTMGVVEVPADKYWGAQTQRSLLNFKIGPAASMPVEIIHAFGYLKKAAAITNEPVYGGRRLSEFLSNRPGTNEPSLFELLTLKQVATGAEPETVRPN